VIDDEARRIKGLMLPVRDKRTVYLQELAIYEAIVALVILRIGTPPFWFFAAQGAGHLLSALVSNKFFWWYGRKAKSALSRILIIGVGCEWVIAGYFFAVKPSLH
jgi:hypothetical protein